MLYLSLLLAATLSGGTPIRDSVDRVTAAVAVKARDRDAQQVFPGAPVHKREKFFGTTNLLLGVGMFGTAVADVETTLSCIGTVTQTVTPMPDGRQFIQTRWCVESKKFMRPFIADGRWASYRGKAYTNIPVWAGSHFMRRSRHVGLKVAGWTLPFVAMGMQAKYAADNVRETRWVRTGVR